MGITCVSGRFFRCSLDVAKSRLFRVFSAFFGESICHGASDPVLLGLVRAKCSPILMYGISSQRSHVNC